MLAMGGLAAVVPKKHVYTFKDLGNNTEIEETEYVDYVTVTVDGEEYTPYQIAIWHLKTEEGYRANPYDDGEFPSVGFGYNFVHGKVSTPISWNEATELLSKTFGNMKTKVKKDNRFSKLDEWQRTAIACRFYNCGEGSIPNYDKPSDLLNCHRGSKGCGYTCRDKKKQTAVRKTHTARRKFEYEMFMKNFENLKIKTLREKCINLQNRK